MPKGEATEQFAASTHVVLDLADKYPRDSLAAYILDVVAQFLPALLTPCSRRSRVRQIVSNAKRFQRGEWKGFWETALRFARREIDTNAKRKRIIAPNMVHLDRLEWCMPNIARGGSTF